MQLDSENLMVPRGLPNLAPLSFEVGEIRRAEERIQEIAFMTPSKAPELMAVFNKAYLDVCRISSAVEYEYELASKHLRETRAVLLIDKVPQRLKEKGLSTTKSPNGSEDYRQALLDLDPDYSKAQETLINIKCYLSLLEGKKKSIEMAYTATKKILGESFQNRSNPHLTTGTVGEFFTYGK